VKCSRAEPLLVLPDFTLKAHQNWFDEEIIIPYIDEKLGDEFDI
jgi:hypothetical protein